MIIYSILFITLLLGFIAIGLLVKPKHWSRLLLGCSLAVFIHLYGGWFLISYYARYVFDALAIFFLLGKILKGIPLGKKAPWRIGVNILFTLLFATLSVLYFTGTKPSPPVANLHFPFKAGTYFVLQGGKGLPSNLFHGSSPHSIYALDIVKLNVAGQRSSRIFSKNLNDYFIFADTIYSPCDGVVERAIDDNPDNIPPNHIRGPHNLNGVVITANDYTVFLGHMKRQCVFVKAGDVVKTGTPLGLAGNSGFSIEPHLHIQVHEKSRDSEPWYRQKPMYVSFDGHEYLLFQLINAVP
jgi:hypothetical protein